MEKFAFFSNYLFFMFCSLQQNKKQQQQPIGYICLTYEHERSS